MPSPSRTLLDDPASSLSGNEWRAERTLARLVHVADPAGHLPETYDPLTGATIARHWFAWPGAVLGALWLLDSRGILLERLRVARTTDSPGAPDDYHAATACESGS